MLIWNPVRVFFFSLPPPIVCFMIAPPLIVLGGVGGAARAVIRAIIATTIAGDGRLLLERAHLDSLRFEEELVEIR